MNSRKRTKFGIKIDKMWDGWWSFGMCLSHSLNETYLFINLIKISVSIGFLEKDTDYE